MASLQMVEVLEVPLDRRLTELLVVPAEYYLYYSNCI